MGRHVTAAVFRQKHVRDVFRPAGERSPRRAPARVGSPAGPMPVPPTVTTNREAFRGWLSMRVITRAGISGPERSPDQVSPSSRLRKMPPRLRAGPHLPRRGRRNFDRRDRRAVEFRRNRLPIAPILGRAPQAARAHPQRARMRRVDRQHGNRILMMLVLLHVLRADLFPEVLAPVLRPRCGGRCGCRSASRTTWFSSSGSNTIHAPSPPSTCRKSPSLPVTPVTRLPLSCAPPPKILPLRGATSMS